MCVCSLPMTSAIRGRKQPLPPPNHRISLSHILRRLKMCDWYWGDMSSQEANDILKNEMNGSFIVRDSNDACHLFTLSLKANDFVISVRVTFSRGQFKLDSCRQDDCPSFDSVVDLIDYYLESEIHTFYVTVPELGEFPVTLKHPIIKEISTLQHLCRKNIVSCCKAARRLKGLPLPQHVVRYLLEFAPEERLTESDSVVTLQTRPGYCIGTST